MAKVDTWRFSRRFQNCVPWLLEESTHLKFQDNDVKKISHLQDSSKKQTCLLPCHTCVFQMVKFFIKKIVIKSGGM